MEELMLIGDVAKILDVQIHRISYLYTSRNIKKEPRRLGQRRVFDATDLSHIASALGIHQIVEIGV